MAETMEVSKWPSSSLEKNSFLSGFDVIAGIDEVGRGSLAGPVVSAALILEKKYLTKNSLKINDSKKISAKRRLKIYLELLNTNSNFGMGISPHQEIDQLGIVEATKLSMLRAISNCSKMPELLLIDSVNFDDYPTPSISFNKADSKSISVAGASIIAKVIRDNLMVKIYDPLYPIYELKNNKGYGTLNHINLIKKYGVSKIHRKTFKLSGVPN